MSETKEITIGGVIYTPKSEQIPDTNGMPFVLVRTDTAGVHFGYLKNKAGKEVVLLHSVRVYSWAGAATLSQLSQEGTKSPESCKFAMKVRELILTEAIEIIPITEMAEKSLKGVVAWKK